MTSMRKIAVGIGLLAFGALLGGCVTFCLEPEGGAAGLPADRVTYDAKGRPCVEVTVFDVIDAFGDRDDAP